MGKQMTKKEAIDLMAYFTLMAVSKQGEALVQKYFTQEQIDKMMATVVHLFKEDNEKAEMFIVNQAMRLLNKLQDHELPESQRKNFPKRGNENE